MEIRNRHISFCKRKMPFHNKSPSIRPGHLYIPSFYLSVVKGSFPFRFFAIPVTGVRKDTGQGNTRGPQGHIARSTHHMACRQVAMAGASCIRGKAHRILSIRGRSMEGGQRDMPRSGFRMEVGRRQMLLGNFHLYMRSSKMYIRRCVVHATVEQIHLGHIGMAWSRRPMPTVHFRMAWLQMHISSTKPRMPLRTKMISFGGLDIPSGRQHFPFGTLYHSFAASISVLISRTWPFFLMLVSSPLVRMSWIFHRLTPSSKAACFTVINRSSSYASSSVKIPVPRADSSGSKGSLRSSSS